MVSPGIGNARQCQPDIAALKRYLASTTDISKKLVTREAVERLRGQEIVFGEPVQFELKQPWMVQPVALTIAKVKIQTNSEGHATTYIIGPDAKVVTLQGGNTAELACMAR